MEEAMIESLKKFLPQMIDMKLAKEKAKKMAAPEPVGKGPRYPYGLELNLEKDQLKKLGLSTKGRKVGEKGTIVAEYEISSISERQQQSGEDSQSMSLQITKLKIIK